ncbi:MAG: response regulator [Gammaproteobacteria bacterium]|nr:response regulator [Gammaproteobacteria bacterium]
MSSLVNTPVNQIGIDNSKLLQRKLLHSHLWVAFVGVLILIIGSAASLLLREHARELAVVNNPTTLALSTLQHGIKKSDGFLRDWVIFKDASYTRKRRAVWKAIIYPAYEKLQTLHENKKSSQLNLVLLEQNLRDIEMWQWHVEDVVRTPGNKPAQVVVDYKLQPMAERLFDVAINLIDLEMQYGGDFENNIMLNTLIQLRTHLYTAHNHLLHYIEHGKMLNMVIYKENIIEVANNVEAIKKVSVLLTELQQEQYEVLLNTFDIYNLLAAEALVIRSSKQWNVSDYWLESKLIPLTQNVVEKLEQQSKLEGELTQQIATKISVINKLLPWLMLVLLVLMLYIAYRLAIEGSSKFIEPVIKLAKQDLLKSHLSQVAHQIEASENITELSESVIATLVKHTQALSGVLYVVENDVLKISAGYALVRNAKDATIKRGQGLIGQVWINKESMELTSLVNKDFNVQSSLINVTPNSVFIFPVIYDDEVIAVIELVSSAAFSEEHKQLLDKVSRQIAVRLHTVQQQMIIQTSLKKSQALSEELQSQQEELRVSNEELFSQSEALENQKNYLEISNKELIDKSEDLKQQTIILETARSETQKKAEQLAEASRYKSEFLANMSHELRTPLNSLLLLARSLADNDEGNLSEDDVDSAQVIEDSGRHLLMLINDILDISKVEAGQMKAVVSNFDINDVCQSLNSRFKHMAEDKGITFDITLDQDMACDINTDQSKLEQILTNLISNAIKFTEQGKVALHISHSAENKTTNEQSAMISFVVKDDGIGIAQNKQQEVFEAFKQADGSTSRTHSGTGLGLSIAKSFSNLLGGDISLYSEPGCGSTFTLNIPATLALVDDEGQHVESTKANVVEFVSQPNEIPFNEVINNPPPFDDDRNQLDENKNLILIIEDDVEFLKILFDTCHKQGCQAIVAPDGETGITLARKYKVCGIILDYILPGRNGADVLNALKFSEDTKYIPVHMISALDDIDDMCKLGAIGNMTKPINTQQIKSIIEQLGNKSKDNELTILMIDDNEDVYKLMREFLSDNDAINLKAARTAQQAVDIIKEKSLNGIIIDLGLPDMSGIELLEQASKLPGVILPPVIVYTGRLLSDEEQIRLEPFIESVVIKSVRSHERLLEEINMFAGHMARNCEQADDVAFEKNSKTINLEGTSILLVDDDMRNTFALAKVLRKRGLHVHLAPSGKEALKQLDEVENIDVVLMDIMMPDMDGYETMRHIRKQDKFKKLPVIALTANAMKGDKDKCIAAGANDYLSKPVDVNNLMDVMRMWA